MQTRDDLICEATARRKGIHFAETLISLLLIALLDNAEVTNESAEPVNNSYLKRFRDFRAAIRQLYRLT